MPDKPAVAVFSISTKDYAKRGNLSLDSFVKNCNYEVDINNIIVEDIIDYKYDYVDIKKFVDKYKSDQNKLRWSLKPAFIKYFLLIKKYDIVIYIDNDIYFVNNADFLIENISAGVLLTKHHRPLYPSGNPLLNNQFLCNFTDGFFNAGFIRANKFGLEAMEWWSDMNYWQCSKIKSHGLFDDQKYLDIMALEFNKNIDICDHPGCNLASWNSLTIKRELINNCWIINNNYKPIFCHFSDMNYNKSFDPMLHEFYEQYNNELSNV